MEIIKIIALILNVTFGLYHVGLYFKSKDRFDLILATLNISAVIIYLTR
jgi:hypothetical protein